MKNAFRRLFLNQFEFTRYTKKSFFYDNEKFWRKYDWLVSSMKKKLFDGLKAHLMRERMFITKKGGIFKNEVCMLVGLNRKNVDAKVVVLDLFYANMFKVRGFSNSMKFLKTDVHKQLLNLTKQNNMTKSDISSSCKLEVRFIGGL